MSRIRVAQETNEAAAEFVTGELRRFNDESNPLVAKRRDDPNDPYPVSFFARDDENNIVGGVMGHVWKTWHWLDVDILWVSETHRGQGLGSTLMDAIEAEGIRQGCTRSRVSSWDFQAPEFYKKRGYIVYGVLPDFPEGAQDTKLWKPLASF